MNISIWYFFCLFVVQLLAMSAFTILIIFSIGQMLKDKDTDIKTDKEY